MARRYEAIPDALKLLGGGLVGLGVGMLLAPRSGRQTRKDIARFGQSVVNKSDKVVHEFTDNITDFADSVGKKAASIVRSGEKVTHDAGREILAAFETGKKRLDEQKRRVERMFG